MVPVFDVWSSTIVIFGNAIPTFLFAILLIILFAGGNYFSWFPLRGLFSDNFETLSLGEKILDYFLASDSADHFHSDRGLCNPDDAYQEFLFR